MTGEFEALSEYQTTNNGLVMGNYVHAHDTEHIVKIL